MADFPCATFCDIYSPDRSERSLILIQDFAEQPRLRAPSSPLFAVLSVTSKEHALPSRALSLEDEDTTTRTDNRKATPLDHHSGISPQPDFSVTRTGRTVPTPAVTYRHTLKPLKLPSEAETAALFSDSDPEFGCEPAPASRTRTRGRSLSSLLAEYTDTDEETSPRSVSISSVSLALPAAGSTPHPRSRKRCKTESTALHPNFLEEELARKLSAIYRTEPSSDPYEPVFDF